MVTEAANGPHPERLFLGVSVTEDARRSIETLLERVEIPGRPVAPANWHVTLAFLGDTAAEEKGRLTAALRVERLGAPFSIGFGALGAFPRASRASILWLGVSEGADAMRLLNERVGTAARRAGFRVEERPFTPHVTLSRIRPPGDVRALLKVAAELGHRMEVEAVSLFRSRLGSGSARYEELERFPLR